MHIAWNDLSILQARSIDEYAFVQPLINIFNGIKSHSIEEIFSFIFYSYGFLYFFLNFISSYIYIDDIGNPNFLSSIRLLAISIFCLTILLFYKIINQTKASTSEKMLLILVVLAMPAMWIFSGYIHPDFLMLVLFLASVLFMIKAGTKINRYYWFSIIFYGFAFSIKFQALIFLPFYIWNWFAFLTNNVAKIKYTLGSVIKSIFLIILIFIIANPYILSSQGFDAWITSLAADFLSNKTNHGNDGKVIIQDKLNFALFKFYFDWLVLLFLLLFSTLILFRETLQKSFSVYGGVAAFSLAYFFYLIILVNKSWALYFLPFSLVSIILLIRLPQTLKWKSFTIKKFRLMLISLILILNISNSFEFNKEIFTNYIDGSSLSYDSINKNKIQFVNIRSERLKSQELAKIFPENGNFEILTTPYVNVPFEELNKTYVSVNIIYDFTKIKNLMQNSDAVERNLIFIANKKYGAEIQGMLNETNAELLNITNEYLLFSL